MFRSLSKDRRGASTLEHLVLGAVIALGSLSAWATYRTHIASSVGEMGERLTRAAQARETGAPPGPGAQASALTTGELGDDGRPRLALRAAPLTTAPTPSPRSQTQGMAAPTPTREAGPRVASGDPELSARAPSGPPRPAPRGPAGGAPRAPAPLPRQRPTGSASTAGELLSAPAAPLRPQPRPEGLARTDPRGRLETYRPFIEAASAEHDIPAELIRAVIWVESTVNPNARSGAGAEGLMQLRPATAAWMGVTEDNIRGGTRYLRHLADRFGGDLDLVLAAFNAGPTAVSWHGGVPPFTETQKYVPKVRKRYAAEVGEGRLRTDLRRAPWPRPRPETAAPTEGAAAR